MTPVLEVQKRKRCNSAWIDSVYPSIGPSSYHPLLDVLGKFLCIRLQHVLVDDFIVIYGPLRHENRLLIYDS